MLQQTQAATVILTIIGGCTGFPPSARLPPRLNRRFCAPGKASVIMREREIFTVAPTPSSENWAGNFQMVPTRCGRYPESADTPQTQSQFSRSTDRLPIVEANTARVLTRLFNIRAPIDSTHGRQELWKLSAKLVPKTGRAISKTR